MTEQTCSIDAEHLISDLAELGRVGQAADGGYYREAFSRADLEGRAAVLVFNEPGSPFANPDALGDVLHQFVVNGGEKLRLDPSLGPRFLGRDAGDQAGLGLRQEIVRGPGVDDQGFPDRVEIEIGAQAGELCQAVIARVYAEGFIVIPVNRLAHD